MPKVTIEVAFNDNPFAVSPTWTDVTKWAESFTTTMGRQHELQQVQPSTATITFTNQDGRFSPWNTSGPYYNSGLGITPGHPVRIQATWNSVTYPVFYGYTKAWVPSYGAAIATMQLQCYDGLALLNLNTLDTGAYNLFPVANASYFWTMGDAPASNVAHPLVGGDPLLATGPVTAGVAGPSATTASTAFTIMVGSTMQPASSITLPASYTFAAWVNATAAGELMMNGDSTGLYLNSSSTQFISIGGTATWPIGLIDGNWHYVVGTVSSTAANLYVDGTLAATAAGTTSSGSTFKGIGVHIGTSAPTFGGTVADVEIYPTALTALEIFTQYQIQTAGFVVQDSGARIQAVLNVAGVPSALQNIDTGTVICQAATSSLATTTAMSYLNTVVNTERGLLWQDATGVIQARNRDSVYTTSSSTTSNATFGYASGQLHYLSTNITPTIDDVDLWNNIIVNRTNGIQQVAADSTSQTLYGRRTLKTFTSQLFVNDAESADLASGLLYQYKNPVPRVRSLTTSSTIDSGAALSQMLGRGLLDRITINWRPIDGTATDFSQQSLIEQISHTVTVEQWTTNFAVTPIGTESFFILGTSTLGTGVLGF